jgi:hypothetical protein
MTDIASVSLAKPLETIADELGRSFAEYGFAVVRDHGLERDGGEVHLQLGWRHFGLEVGLVPHNRLEHGNHSATGASFLALLQLGLR